MRGLLLCLLLATCTRTEPARQSTPLKAAPAAPAVAKAPAEPAVTGFWAPFSETGRVFTLRDALREAGEPMRHLEVVVERVEVVSGVSVARLRWTKFEGPQRAAADAPVSLVLLRGDEVRFLWDVPKDADLAQWVNEPMAYRGVPPAGHEEGDVRVEHHDDGRVCLFLDRAVAGEQCEDTCFGEMCFRERLGLVSVAGLWAPEWGEWASVSAQLEDGGR